MKNQNYLMVNEATNLVDNVCLWDGNTNTWQPPAGYLMLVAAETPAKLWELNANKTAYELVAVMGAGAIGFSWDGIYVITNEPQPEPPIPTGV